LQPPRWQPLDTFHRADPYSPCEELSTYYVIRECRLPNRARLPRGSRQSHILLVARLHRRMSLQSTGTSLDGPPSSRYTENWSRVKRSGIRSASRLAASSSDTGDLPHRVHIPHTLGVLIWHEGANASRSRHCDLGRQRAAKRVAVLEPNGHDLAGDRLGQVEDGRGVRVERVRRDTDH